MGNGYKTFPVDPLEQLRSDLSSLRSRVAELERPSGTQLADSVTTLTATVAGLSDTNDTLTSAVAQLQANANAGYDYHNYDGPDLYGLPSVGACTITFARPVWATRCIVMATSTVSASTTNQSSNPISGSNFGTSIGGVTGSATPTFDTVASNVWTSKAVPFARAFATTSDVVVRTEVLAAVTASVGAVASFGLAATIFWYSN